MVYKLLVGINVFAFILMGYDKLMAKNGGWRVAEKSLFIISTAGGSIGVFLGMRAFRHKTRHQAFKIGIPLLIGLNIICLYFLTKYFS